MADKQAKMTKNVSGKFYVDSTCIGCCQCVDLAGDCFAEDGESGTAYVFKQPNNQETEKACNEAMSNCPVEAIGNDGE